MAEVPRRCRKCNKWLWVVSTSAQVAANSIDRACATYASESPYPMLGMVVRSTVGEWGELDPCQVYKKKG